MVLTPREASIPDRTTMLLYHFSSEAAQLPVILPMVGAQRHAGEEERLRDVPLIWLTADAYARRADSLGNSAWQWRYEFEISEDDPHLDSDAGFDRSIERYANVFGMAQTPGRWYIYRRPLTPRSVLKL